MESLDELPIYLLGYRGLRYPKFFGLLAEARVEVLLDVRSAPTSPNPDYKQDALREACEEWGVRYSHLPQLGAPSMSSTATVATMEEQLALPAGRAALRKILRTLEGGIGVALLCSEPNYLDCHRPKIVEELQRMDSRVKPVSLTAVGEVRLF